MYVSLVGAGPPCLLLSMLLTMNPSTAPGTASPPRATRWSRSPLPASTTAGTIRWRHATMSRGTRRSCGLRARGRAQLTPVCDQRASCGIRTRRGCTLAVTDRWARYTCCTRAECEMRLRRDVVGSRNYLGYLRPLQKFKIWPSRSFKLQTTMSRLLPKMRNIPLRVWSRCQVADVADLRPRARRLDWKRLAPKSAGYPAGISGVRPWRMRRMAFVFGVLEASSASCR